jgi:REP element-mobilizing transposase RayT
MARRKIQFAKGNYYHIYNRGCNREDIFRSEENYLFLLRRLKEKINVLRTSEVRSTSCVTVIAYCLMPNHYHFLLRQETDVPLSELLQALFNSYSKAFNKMYQRNGTLFDHPLTPP